MNEHEQQQQQDDPLDGIRSQLDNIESRLNGGGDADTAPPATQPDPNLSPVEQIAQLTSRQIHLVDDAMDELRSEFPDAKPEWLTEARDLMRKLPLEQLEVAIKGQHHKKHILTYVGEEAHKANKVPQRERKTPPPTTGVGTMDLNGDIADTLRQTHRNTFGKDPSEAALAKMVKEYKQRKGLA